MIKQIAIQIDAERVRKGLTLRELSLKSGVSEKHISQINTNKTTPTIETLEKLAKPLGLEINISVIATNIKAKNSLNPTIL